MKQWLEPLPRREITPKNARALYLHVLQLAHDTGEVSHRLDQRFQLCQLHLFPTGTQSCQNTQRLLGWVLAAASYLELPRSSALVR